AACCRLTVLKLLLSQPRPLPGVKMPAALATEIVRTFTSTRGWCEPALLRACPFRDNDSSCPLALLPPAAREIPPWTILPVLDRPGRRRCWPGPPPSTSSGAALTWASSWPSPPCHPSS